MNNDIKLYGNGFNPEILKDVKSLNEKIEKEKDPEEVMKLRLQRLYRGMELNTGIMGHPYSGYYPY